MATAVAPLPAAATPLSPTNSQRYDHIEAALRRLDVSLAVAVRWQATWVVMSIVVLVTQIEVAWFHNAGELHTSRVCRVATTTWNSTVLQECLDAPAFVPYTHQRLLLNMLRGVNSVLTVLLLASVAKYHHSQYLIKKLSDVEPVSLRFWGSSVFVPMLGECILCSVHVFPGVEHVISNPNVYLLLVCSMFLRLYVVGRFRFHHSTMGQAPGRFIAGLTNTHLNFAFLVRALLEYNPYSVTITFFTVCMVVAAYLLRVAETVVCASDKHLQCVPLTFTDSLWTLLITVTTVGYGGGSAAASGWGRACTAFLSVVAFLVLAIMVAFAIRWMKLAPTQTIVLAFISRHKQLDLLQSSAAKAIQVAWRYNRLYARSIMWKRGSMGLAYRALSRRLPMEHHYLNTLAEWSKQRNKVAQLAIDGDANYKWLLTNKVSQQVDEVKAVIEFYWHKVLPAHIRVQFDNHLLGLPLDFDPSNPQASFDRRRRKSEIKAQLVAKAAGEASPTDKSPTPVYIVSPALGVVGSDRNLGGTVGSSGSSSRGGTGSGGTSDRSRHSGGAEAGAQQGGDQAGSRASRMDPALLSALAASHRSLSSRSLSPRRRRRASDPQAAAAARAATQPAHRKRAPRRSGSAAQAEPETASFRKRKKSRASRRASLSASGKGAAARAFQRLAQDIGDMNDDMGRATRSMGRMRSSLRDTVALLDSVEHLPSLRLLDAAMANVNAAAGGHARHTHVAPVHEHTAHNGAPGPHVREREAAAGVGVRATGTSVGPAPATASVAQQASPLKANVKGAAHGTGLRAHHPPPHAPPGVMDAAAGVGIRSVS